MNGDAVKELATRFRGPQEIGGAVAVPADWKLVDAAGIVAASPTAEPLAVYSLGAVRDYLKANRDEIDLGRVIIHVVSPQIVMVSGPIIERARNRESYVKATALNLTDGFLSKFMALDEFLVGLQVRFAASDDRASVLKLLGNVKHETVKSAIDDGVTQVVQARAGIALVSDVAVPNPITLTPFRTFREVTQPSSLFVLRVNSGRVGGLPEVGLFEADGGAWRLTAVDLIRDWLGESVPDGTAVLA